MTDFLVQRGHYKKLKVYQKAECLYDITFYFVRTHLQIGDRTVDQMLQAARSGKQNIAEGSKAGSTSKQSEIKLFNVAKASFAELLEDYEDYLRARDLSIWAPADPRLEQCRRVCASHCDSQFYRQAVKVRTAETIANIAITLLHQTDVMLTRLIERAKADFLAQGGMREQMTRARLKAKKE